MPDFTCPDCGTGFPSEAGRVTRRPEFGKHTLGRQVLLRLIDAFVAKQTVEEIHCPHCGTVIVEAEGVAAAPAEQPDTASPDRADGTPSQVPDTAADEQSGDEAFTAEYDEENW